MRVLVAGGSGRLGSEIGRRLAAAGHEVTALVRPGADAGGLERVRATGATPAEGDLERPESLAPAVAGVDAVVSTATSFPVDPRRDAIELVDRRGQLALVDAAAAAGVERFVYVSFRPVAWDFPLQRAKRAVEERLRASALGWTVLRPGKFMDVWFSPMLGFDVRGGRVRVFGEGTAPVSWVAAADVAEAAVAALGADATRGATLELGGPEALSQLDAVEIFERAAGRPLEREHVAVDVLEAQRRGAATPTEESLAALMLEAAHGSVVHLAPALDLLPLRPTSLREFAAAAVG